MGSKRFRIIDADGHVMEPRGMWERYVAPTFRDRAPRVVREADGWTRVSVDARFCPRPVGGYRISSAMQDVFFTRVREHLRAKGVVR